MAMQLKDVEDAMKQLSFEDKIELFHRMAETIDFENAEIDEAWQDEIKRRLEAYRRDPHSSIPAEDVFSEIEDKYL